MWELVLVTEGRLRQPAPRDHLLQKRSEGLRGSPAAVGFGPAPVTMRVDSPLLALYLRVRYKGSRDTKG